MDWSKSYTSSWRVYRVNRRTWADGEQLRGVDSATITRTADGGLLESGSLDATGEFIPDYYRIVMTAEQGGEVLRTDVATMLFVSDSGSNDYGTSQSKADGYSVLYPASVTRIQIGDYAPAGVDGAEYAAELLRNAVNAPVVVEGSFTLNDHVVHEIGTSVLEAAWSVLNAGGYVLQIDGRGIIHILPKPTDPALVIDNRSRGLMLNGTDYNSDTSGIPNRYIVIDGGNRTIAENDDANSPVSFASRGYFVDEIDTSPTAVNGETISEYAVRKLHELSIQTTEYSYKREYAPDVLLYSIARSSIDGMTGDLRVTSQAIECSHGLQVSEKAEKEESLW